MSEWKSFSLKVINLQVYFIDIKQIERTKPLQRKFSLCGTGKRSFLFSFILLIFVINNHHKSHYERNIILYKKQRFFHSAYFARFAMNSKSLLAMFKGRKECKHSRAFEFSAYNRTRRVKIPSTAFTASVVVAREIFVAIVSRAFMLVFCLGKFAFKMFYLNFMHQEVLGIFEKRKLERWHFQFELWLLFCIFHKKWI